MRLSAAILFAMTLCAAVSAQQVASPDPERLPPREVQRLFDAYVLMQAQERLGISDAQYPQFVQRLKALLDARRRTVVARTALIQELARGTSEQAGGLALDEAGIKERLERLERWTAGPDCARPTTRWTRCWSSASARGSGCSSSRWSAARSSC